MNTIIEKIKAEIERLKEKYTNMMPSIEKCSVCDELLAKLDTLQEQPVMIQWMGNNLKEVIEFTGKSPRFDEWFKTWDEYESYVHSHGDILKLFNEDGTHLEVPVGAWIVKTPDGRNVPSTFIRQEQPVCENVEEAAKAYADDINSNECLYTYTDFTDAFKAGAKWGAEHSGSSEIPNDLEEAAEEWVRLIMRCPSKAHEFLYTYLLDAVRFGAKWQKEQMMKNAVEGEVVKDINNRLAITANR